MVFLAALAEGILHVLEALPLEEDVELVVFYLHDVWVLAVYEDYSVA